VFLWLVAAQWAVVFVTGLIVTLAWFHPEVHQERDGAL
jgi:hypothetical protein